MDSFSLKKYANMKNICVPLYGDTHGLWFTSIIFLFKALNPGLSFELLLMNNIGANNGKVPQFDPQLMNISLMTHLAHQV